MIQFKQFRDPQLDTSGDVAAFYPREFYPLCNFSSFQVEWRGRSWPTSEHAYQAAHFFETAPELAEQIFRAKSAHEAYKLAKANGHRAPKNWEVIKESVMLDICRHKLQQHEYVRAKLLETGDAKIVEDSPKDSFWGWGPDRRGRNALGKIWMQLRDELRAIEELK
jgi:N-glycosidase YbiA